MGKMWGPLLLSMAAAIVQGCSNFRLNYPGEFVSARTMDFSLDLNTLVEVVPRGTVVQELVVHHCPDCPDYAWTTKYGFVGMNIFGVDIASDGLNEAGLSAAFLYLDGTVYPRANTSDPRPIITSYVSYFLGNFASVEDVKAHLDDVQFSDFDPRLATLFNPAAKEDLFPLHVIIHDAVGESLVLEFLNGTLHTYSNDVLTNDPPLEQQLAAVQAHGDKPLPGSIGSTDRFIRLSLLNRHAADPYHTNMSYSRATPDQGAVNLAFHIINSVTIQTGHQASGEATQWTVVRDHGRRVLYVTTNENLVVRRLDLSQLDFRVGTPRHALPVVYGQWFVDVTAAEVASSQRSIDLPPRSIVEKMLNGSSTSPLFQHVSTPLQGFVGGAVAGLLCALAIGMAALYFLLPRRPVGYRPLP
ncbi:Aste57867_14959 [Aphanomyces stellatus]|uniref:Aste57867_14959 protein n=1 Tax=Aphanomyces stellatus TaxID=120398 RepID=A0A485L2W6_9STRA|nr:hypothetical protein As57867_014903 [Aphanomyces stellatus]VFT91773.1 Aste57867_14959 [Aphanomyces stellatus]